jgi:hypothetical protein
MSRDLLASSICLASKAAQFSVLLIFVKLLLQVVTYPDLGHDQWLRQALWLAVAE